MSAQPTPRVVDSVTAVVLGAVLSFCAYGLINSLLYLLHRAQHGSFKHSLSFDNGLWVVDGEPIGMVLGTPSTANFLMIIFFSYVGYKLYQIWIAPQPEQA